MTICIIDTSIFCELLDLPTMNERRAVVQRELKRKERAREWLLLPSATILETGNHIGQIRDGRLRRARASDFAATVRRAIEGDLPFTPITAISSDDLRVWLAEFPDWAMAGSGLGDLSIKKEYDRQCARHPKRRVYVWSLDRHLSGYDRAP